MRVDALDEVPILFAKTHDSRGELDLLYRVEQWEDADRHVEELIQPASRPDSHSVRQKTRLLADSRSEVK